MSIKINPKEFDFTKKYKELVRVFKSQVESSVLPLLSIVRDSNDFYVFYIYSDPDRWNMYIQKISAEELVDSVLQTLTESEDYFTDLQKIDGLELEFVVNPSPIQIVDLNTSSLVGFVNSNLQKKE